MSSEEFSGLIVETGEDHVATITINRPDAMNSFDIPMIEAFERLWRYIKNEDSIHSVVLRAAPGRAQAP
jgi:enoyl-CoA hydratase/carnithine racemase